MATKKYRSDIAGAVHRTVKDLHQAGLVDKKTMRGFDVRCLTNVEPLEPQQIVAIREKAGVSQSVFAHYLNVRATVVSQWERGERRPTSAALKLLNLAKQKGLEAIA